VFKPVLDPQRKGLTINFFCVVIQSIQKSGGGFFKNLKEDESHLKKSIPESNRFFP
jgi:hypothetical protein